MRNRDLVESWWRSEFPQGWAGDGAAKTGAEDGCGKGRKIWQFFMLSFGRSKSWDGWGACDISLVTFDLDQ